MSGIEYSVFPIGGGDIVISSLLGVGVVAQGRNELIFAVENGNAAFQFGDGNVIAQDRDRTRQLQILGNDGDEISVEIEMLETAVGAIADQQQRFLAALIERDAMTGREFSGFLAWPAEAFDVLLVFIELVNPVLPIAINDVDIAIGADGDSGGMVLAFVFVLAGFHGYTDGPDLGAVEFQFDDAGVIVECAVDELFAIFFVEADAVDADEFFSTYGFDHFAVGAVDEEGVVAGVHAEIDLALFINDYAAMG